MDEFNNFLLDLYSNRDQYSKGYIIDKVRDELKKYKLSTPKISECPMCGYTNNYTHPSGMSICGKCSKNF